MLHPIIATSMLACDFGDLTRECKKVCSQGSDWLHMDVMDGHFVNDITIGPPIIASVARNFPEAYLDCHMMVSNPGKWIDSIAKAGGTSYTFHMEATTAEEAPELIRRIHSKHMRAAVGINPGTPSEVITDEIGNMADMLLVMTVRPGAGGQAFMQDCVIKINELRARFPGKDIQVDGGVKDYNVHICADAGSNVIVSGTGVLNSKSPSDTMKFMKEAIAKGLEKMHLPFLPNDVPHQKDHLPDENTDDPKRVEKESPELKEEVQEKEKLKGEEKELLESQGKGKVETQEVDAISVVVEKAKA